MKQLLYLNGEEIGYIIFSDNIIFNITKDCDISEYNELVKMVEDMFVYKTKQYTGLTLEPVKPYATAIEKVNNQISNIKEEEHKLINSLREELKDFFIDGENIIDIFTNFTLTLENDFKEPRKGHIHYWDDSNAITSFGYLLIMREHKLILERYDNTYYTNGHTNSDQRYIWNENVKDKDIIIGYTYNSLEDSLEDGGSLILFTKPYIYRCIERISTLSNWKTFIDSIKEY